MFPFHSKELSLQLFLQNMAFGSVNFEYQSWACLEEFSRAIPTKVLPRKNIRPGASNHSLFGENITKQVFPTELAGPRTIKGYFLKVFKLAREYCTPLVVCVCVCVCVCV